MRRIFTVVAVLCLVHLATAAAHDPGLSSLSIRILPDSIEALLEVDVADLADAALDADALRLEIGGRELRPVSSERSQDHPHHPALRLRYPRPEGARLRITSELLRQLPFGHKQHLRVESASGSVDRILSASAPGFDIGGL